MVSAISLCLLALGLSAASSQLISGDEDYSEVSTSDRRTFKHGKPVRLLPLAKGPKKFAGFIPHVFSKPSDSELPLIQGIGKPFKNHKHQSVYLKPALDVSPSTPEPFEAHVVELPLPSDVVSNFGSDPDPPHPPVVYHDKPIFSAPLPPHPPLKPLLPVVASQPIFPGAHIPPAIPSVPLIRPAPLPPFLQPAPLLPQVTPAHASLHTPVIPTLSFPPLFQIVRIAAVPPPISSPLPSHISPPSPAPFLPAVSIVAPTHPPTQFPSSPALPSLPTVSSFPSVPEPELPPYPPSGSPIPSYISDISLANVEIKGSAPVKLPTIEVIKPTALKEGPNVLGDVKPDALFHNFKGWKVDKPSSALSHFPHLKPKPADTPSASTVPLDILTYPIPASPQPLPLAPAPIFFPPGQFFSPVKYENFPPNNIESPPLFNSYGAPIPHDTYSHVPHERLSSAASEDEPAVVAAPAKNTQQQVQQQRFQPQAELPVYEEKTKEENKIEDARPESDEYKAQNEQVAEDAAAAAAVAYPNHKE